MQFNLPQENITKDVLLNQVSQEDIFCYYMGISEIKRKLYLSPIRIDHKPTCSFYKGGNGVLYLKDFATGDSINCFDLVKHKYNCDYFEAVKIIANDFGVKSYLNSPKRVIIQYNHDVKTKESFSKIQIQRREFTQQDLEYWQQFGISAEILQKYDVHSCRATFLNDRLYTSNDNNLVFGYFGGIADERELWRIYYPGNKERRFVTNWPATKIQGWDQLPETGKLVCITKSMKDVMCLHSLHIPACAPNSEHLFLSDEQLDNLKSRFKYVVTLYDNDQPGLQGMIKIKKQHPELLYTWIPRKYKAKDISDFYKLYGKINTEKLIKYYVGHRIKRTEK